MNETVCRPEIESILELAKKNAWRNEERKRLREFRSKLGTPAEVAELLEVSVATIYSWEKQMETDQPLPPPPQRKLHKFLEIIENKGSDIGDEDIAILGKVRKVDYLFQCGIICKTFWTLRGGKPFVALNDDKMLDAIIEFVKLPTSPQSFIVYPKFQRRVGKGKPKFTDSKVSCDGLILKLQKRLAELGLPRLERLMKPVEISDQNEAIVLGLTDSWTAIAMAEYGPEGYARLGKSVDVWMEFVFDISKDPQSERRECTRWLELPREQAESWRDQRQKFWDKARAKVD